jgi:hypothetical protein
MVCRTERPNGAKGMPPPSFAQRGGKLLKTNETSAEKRAKRKQEAASF